MTKAAPLASLFSSPGATSCSCFIPGPFQPSVGRPNIARCPASASDDNTPPPTPRENDPCMRQRTYVLCCTYEAGRCHRNLIASYLARFGASGRLAIFSTYANVDQQGCSGDGRVPAPRYELLRATYRLYARYLCTRGRGGLVLELLSGRVSSRAIARSSRRWLCWQAASSSLRRSDV